MEQFNVYALCQDRNTKSTGTLDLNTLSAPSKKEHNVKSIIEENNRKNKIKYEYMNKIYDNCWSEIERTNKLNGRDIVVKIVRNIPDCPLYNGHECLLYISSQLRKQNFNTLEIDEGTLFISWADICNNNTLIV